MELADERSPDLDVQAARYYLCFLNWELGRLQEAAELGATIAREFAGSEYARPAAKVALSAYDQLYRMADNDEDAQQLQEQLRGIAELIAKRWPNSEEATAAAGLLISLALEENRLDLAESMLDQLPDSGRASGELSLGAALWTTYLKSVSANPDSVDGAAKQRAGELLASGYEGIRTAGGITAANATGLLYYAQLLLGEGDADRALEVLQDPAVGPLALVGQGRFSDRVDLLIEIYKASLRAFLAASPPQREKVQEMIAALESAVAQGGQEFDLTGVYVSLGLQLEQQIRELNAAGRGDQALELVGAFEDVLAQVAQRPDAADWQIRNWLARTYLQLGRLLDAGPSKAMVERAEQQFRAILEQSEREPSFAPSDAAILGVSKQLADCRLALGNFKEALEEYVRILRNRPTLLELQIASAEALQQWGVAEKRPGALKQAISGALPQGDGKNLVWGWIRLAQVAEAAKRRAAASGTSQDATAQAKKYEDLFYRARYNAALARFQSAQLASAGKKTSQLRTVRQSIASLKTLYPDLGGPRWKPRFDRLLEQVERQLQ